MVKIAQRKERSNIISIFEDEIKRIQTEINNYESENKKKNHIAIISEPYSGIDHIFNKITGDNSQNINDIKLFNPVRNRDFFTNFYTGKKVILLRNSQYLYTRKAGGFEIYKAFLDELTSSDRLFITGWNKFAWNYLKEISNIESLFPVLIEVPELDSISLMKIIMSGIDEKVVFTDDRDLEEHRNFLMPATYKIDIPFLNIHRSIRYLKPDFNSIKRDSKITDMQDIQKEVFLRIARLAGGKYDVAYRIWKNTLKDNEIKLSQIPIKPPEKALDINESFVLSIILSMEAVDYSDLLDITGPETNLRQLIKILAYSGLIEDHNGIYKINPEAVNFIAGNLGKNRMVW